jgi:hypothetical protein
VQAADVVILVPPDDSAAERQRFVLVVWLARTYAVCGHTCPSAERRREFGIGADDCVSSVASAWHSTASNARIRREQELDQTVP